MRIYKDKNNMRVTVLRIPKSEGLIIPPPITTPDLNSQVLSLCLSVSLSLYLSLSLCVCVCV